MRGGLSARLASFAAIGSLGACTSLYFVHDPQSGIISAGEVPGILKSLRCELVLFYDIERRRKAAFARLQKISVEEAFAKFAYFEVEPTLYGTFTVELKVTDSAGALAGATAFDFKQALNAASTATEQVAPTASTQSTYDLIYSFLIRQDAELTSIQSPSDPLHRGCYDGPPLRLADLEQLADNESPYPVTFTRIRVNGVKPFAAWLRDNGKVVSANYLGTGLTADSADPSQMTYTFTIQVLAGLEAKYSLVSTNYLPTVEASGGLQQNSTLTMYINGPAAPTANAAKAGGGSSKPPSPPLGSKGNPMYISNEPGKAAPRVEGQPSGVAPSGGPHIRGYLLTPLTVTPPAATPNP